MDRDDRRRYFIVGSVILEIVTPLFTQKLENNYKSNGFGSLSAFLNDRPVIHIMFHLKHRITDCCKDRTNCTNNKNYSLTHQQWNMLYSEISGQEHHHCFCKYKAKPISLSDLDITLAGLILLNCCSLMSEDERSIWTLLHLKNKHLSNNTTGIISKNEYKSLWIELTTQISRLDSNILDKLTRIEKRPIDEALCNKYITCLLDINSKLEDLEGSKNYVMDRSLNLPSLQSNVPASLQTPQGNPEFVKLPTKHQCLLCHNVMRDAVMTQCGHRMCESCLMAELFNPQRKTPLICPGKEEFCNEIKAEEIRGDNGTRREIRKLPVYCTYRPYGCQEKIQWKDLAIHESNCKHKPVPCPHEGCQELLNPENLDEHVKMCSYRPVQCSHCGNTIPYNQQKIHEDQECRKIIIPCPYKCECKPRPREEIDIHKESCPQKPQKCKFNPMGCDFEGKDSDMQKHSKDAADEHLQMITVYTAEMDLQSMEMRRELQDISSERERIQGHIDSIHKDYLSLKEMVDSIRIGQKELKLKIVEKTERIIHLEKKVDDLAKKEVVDKLGRDVQAVKDRQSMMTERINQLERSGFAGGGTGSQQEAQAATGTLVTQIQQHDRQLGLQDIRLAELDLRFQVLETASYNGVLMWKIRDYSRRKQEAITGRTVSLYSQPFYTSRFGYKMCARLYLNGDGMGKGTHLSLFFVVMRSEYDALLPWPFQQKVTMLLLDQDNGARHISDTFRPDPTSTSFKRPTTDMNIASGCPLFASHTVLETRTYLKDDTIFIKVIVDTDGINSFG